MQSQIIRNLSLTIPPFPTGLGNSLMGRVAVAKKGTLLRYFRYFVRGEGLELANPFNNWKQNSWYTFFCLHRFRKNGVRIEDGERLLGRRRRSIVSENIDWGMYWKITTFNPPLPFSPDSCRGADP